MLRLAYPSWGLPSSIMCTLEKLFLPLCFRFLWPCMFVGNENKNGSFALKWTKRKKEKKIPDDWIWISKRAQKVEVNHLKDFDAEHERKHQLVHLEQWPAHIDIQGVRKIIVEVYDTLFNLRGLCSAFCCSYKQINKPWKTILVHGVH